jgi:hypothetical protein
MTEQHPNSKLYQLTWNDTGVPYVSADHRTRFTLGEAMRIADGEEVSVVDPETSRVLWVGSEPTRSAIA